MKKIKKMTALVLALVMGTLFFGCDQQQEGTASNNSSDALITDYYDGNSTIAISKEAILEQSTAGNFTAKNADEEDVLVSLGETYEELITAIPENTMTSMEGNTYIKYSTGMSDFYYLKSQMEKGIINIVHFGMAFGFEVGITNRDSIVAVLGEPQEEGTATAGQQAILPDPNAVVLRMVYYCEENRLEFYLINDLLVATSLSSAQEWQPA